MHTRRHESTLIELRQPYVRSVAVALLASAFAAACAPNDAPAPAARSAQRVPIAPDAPQAAMPHDPESKRVKSVSRTHCASGENVVFSCALGNSNRVASLCLPSDATPTAKSARYIEGPIGSPQVALIQGMPPDVPVTFARTPLTFAGGTGGYALSVSRGDEVHVIYSISGDGQLLRQGVMRTDVNVERVLADTECRPGSVVESEDVAILHAVRAWPAQPRLEQAGLPSTKP